MYLWLRRLSVVMVAASATSSPRVASAGPDAQARQGLAAARRRDCVKAVPLLEEAELARHRPETAFALANCYIATGELIRAAEMFHALIDEKPSKRWSKADRDAQAQSKKNADEIDARIPTLRFQNIERYEDLEIEIDGHVLSELDQPHRIVPDVSHVLVARATGMKEHTEKILVGEGERKVLMVELEPLEEAGPPPEPEEAQPKAKPKERVTKSWIGARFQGYVIPQFVMNFVGDGGASVFVPGGAVGYTTFTGDVDATISLGYAYYGLGDTPFKPKNTPATEWEIINSDLQALYLTVELFYTAKLNAARTLEFRLGGGVGVGWTFLGDLHRTQAYPPKGAGSDPYNWAKCKGPDNPPGSFRYCNQLDKDASHYGDFSEPNWFQGGARPLLYPWVAFPELGLSYYPSPRVAIDLSAGLSITGVITALGFRYGL